MIECDADEVNEDLIREAFRLGVEEIQKVHTMQQDFITACGVIEKKEIAYNKPSDDLLHWVETVITPEKFAAMTGHAKV